MADYVRTAAKIIFVRLSIDLGLSAALTLIAFGLASAFLATFRFALNIPQHYANIAALLCFFGYSVLNISNAFVRHKTLLSRFTNAEESLGTEGSGNDES